MERQFVPKDFRIGSFCSEFVFRSNLGLRLFSLVLNLMNFSNFCFHYSTYSRLLLNCTVTSNVNVDVFDKLKLNPDIFSLVLKKQCWCGMLLPFSYQSCYMNLLPLTLTVAFTDSRQFFLIFDFCSLTEAFLICPRYRPGPFGK